MENPWKAIDHRGEPDRFPIDRWKRGYPQGKVGDGLWIYGRKIGIWAAELVDYEQPEWHLSPRMEKGKIVPWSLVSHWTEGPGSEVFVPPPSPPKIAFINAFEKKIVPTIWMVSIVIAFFGVMGMDSKIAVLEKRLFRPLHSGEEFEPKRASGVPMVALGVNMAAVLYMLRKQA